MTTSPSSHPFLRSRHTGCPLFAHTLPKDPNDIGLSPVPSVFSRFPRTDTPVLKPSFPSRKCLQAAKSTFKLKTLKGKQIVGTVSAEDRSHSDAHTQTLCQNKQVPQTRLMLMTSADQHASAPLCFKKCHSSLWKREQTRSIKVFLKYTVMRYLASNLQPRYTPYLLARLFISGRMQPYLR